MDARGEITGTENGSLVQVTAAQRERIYLYEAEERRRKKRKSLYGYAKTLAVIYVLGCLLIYSGIPEAVWHLCTTGEWEHELHPDFFETLRNSVAMLVGSAGILLMPFIILGG